VTTSPEPAGRSPRPRRRRAARGQGELLRDEILEATEQLLEDLGDVEAVSIRSVADAVGVTPPSIYRHFADKTDLVFAVCQRQFERMALALRGAVAGLDDPVARLEHLGRAYVRFGLDNPEHYRVLMMGHPDVRPPGFDVTSLLADAAFSLLLEILRDGMAAGLLREIEPLDAGIAVWTAVHGLTAIAISKPDVALPVVDRALETVIDTQIRGLATPAGLAAWERHRAAGVV
jgi:AcrR family transcriptional regulator